MFIDGIFKGIKSLKNPMLKNRLLENSQIQNTNSL